MALLPFQEEFSVERPDVQRDEQVVVGYRFASYISNLLWSNLRQTRRVKWLEHDNHGATLTTSVYNGRRGKDSISKIVAHSCILGDGNVYSEISLTKVGQQTFWRPAYTQGISNYWNIGGEPLIRSDAGVQNAPQATQRPVAPVQWKTPDMLATASNQPVLAQDDRTLLAIEMEQGTNHQPVSARELEGLIKFVGLPESLVLPQYF